MASPSRPRGRGDCRAPLTRPRADSRKCFAAKRACRPRSSARDSAARVGAVADDAMFALRKVAEERVGELTDALVDPNQAFAVRRRLARVFSVCVSQRAADGLMLGLDDLRFDVRCQCARSLAAHPREESAVRIDGERIFDVVLREVGGRPAGVGKPAAAPSVDVAPNRLRRFVHDRASQSLAHVFTLLVAGAAARAAADRVSRPAHRRSATSRARRSSISRACCRRRFAAAVAVPRRRRPAAGKARPREEILATCCDRTIRSC